MIYSDSGRKRQRSSSFWSAVCVCSTDVGRCRKYVSFCWFSYKRFNVELRVIFKTKNMNASEFDFISYHHECLGGYSWAYSILELGENCYSIQFRFTGSHFQFNQVCQLRMSKRSSNLMKLHFKYLFTVTLSRWVLLIVWLFTSVELVVHY